MNKKVLIYIIIAASILLMIINVTQLDFSNITWGSSSGILSNLLLIIAMIISLRELKKSEKAQK